MKNLLTIGILIALVFAPLGCDAIVPPRAPTRAPGIRDLPAATQTAIADMEAFLRAPLPPAEIKDLPEATQTAIHDAKEMAIVAAMLPATTYVTMTVVITATPLPATAMPTPTATGTATPIVITKVITAVPTPDLTPKPSCVNVLLKYGQNGDELLNWERLRSGAPFPKNRYAPSPQRKYQTQFNKYCLLKNGDQIEGLIAFLQKEQPGGYEKPEGLVARLDKVRWEKSGTDTDTHPAYGIFRVGNSMEGRVGFYMADGGVKCWVPKTWQQCGIPMPEELLNVEF